MGELIVFESSKLTPMQWRDSDIGKGPVRCFNPAIYKHSSSWIMAYRFVGSDESRKIGICRLDNNFNIIPNSLIPWSDLISVKGRRWFADPRFFYLEGKLYIYWNSGWEEPFNRQFLHEIDPVTLMPIGASREIKLKSGNTKLEKNWMFFDSIKPKAIYSVSPHKVLNVDLSGLEEVVCDISSSQDWDLTAYISKYGPLRGSCPPQQIGDRFFSLCHSVFGNEGDYRYVAAFYCFSAISPYKPLGFSHNPIELPNPWGNARDYPKLNPAVGEVIYPCGAVYENGSWFISYGINDEQCAITKLSHKDVLESFSGLKS
jgi:predicted GH43/DUF377 family glycosyl hydrolase